MTELRIGNYVIKEPLLNILEEIKIELSGNKLADIRPKDDEILVTCPNDNHAGGCEKTPDCHINLLDVNDSENINKIEYGYFHCFACNASGDFVKFVALCFSSNEEFAKKWLIQNYGELKFSHTIQLERFSPINKNKPNKVQYLDESILDKYQPWTPYLQKRGLKRNVCEYFKVKYDPKFRQVIFPCYDIHNKLVMLPKRNIDTKVFYLDKDVSKPLYCVNYIVEHNLKNICLVEGPIDCLTCYSNNIPAVATLGSPAEEQFEILNKLQLKHIYLMFDNDEAGQKFTAYAKAHLNKRILIDVVKIPNGKKDINDLSPEEITELIKQYKLPTLV